MRFSDLAADVTPNQALATSRLCRALCHAPVDPSIPKRPIRFKLSVRTGNPLLWVSQNLPADEATGHLPQLQNVNKRKNHWGHETRCDSTL